MVKGQPPNVKVRNKRQLGAELNRNPPRLSPDDGVSSELCDFLEFILQPDPSSRPKAVNLLEHPYLKGTEKTHPTTVLVDLVIQFTNWEQSGGARSSLLMTRPPNPAVVEAEESPYVHEKVDEWRFSLAPVDPAEVDAMIARGRELGREGAEREESVPGLSEYPEGSSQSPSVTASKAQLITADYDQNETPPKPKMPLTFDQRAARRGEQNLAGLFRSQSSPDHPAQSDLPLRNIASSSDVRSKEVFAPDPNQPRMLGAGSIPDIGSVNMDTIKQNRMLTRSGANIPSDSSGDELGEGPSRRPKRSTMAWQPNWNETVTAAEEPHFNDPFRAFAGFPSSSTAHLAPPTALQRPGLHQANTAPGVIPTASNPTGGDVRASTASVLDMDALMGGDLMPSTSTSHSFGESSPMQPSGESTTSPDNFDELQTGEAIEERHLAEHGQHLGLFQQPSPPSSEDFVSDVRVNQGAATSTAPPQGPSDAAMAHGATPAEMAGEFTRLTGGFLGELDSLLDDIYGQFNEEFGEMPDVEEDEEEEVAEAAEEDRGDEAYDGGNE